MKIITNNRCRWVECDNCKSTFHYKCIPKKLLVLYGLDEEDKDEDEVNFNELQLQSVRCRQQRQ